MNLKLLEKIHQIHQDLADGKEVELLNLTKNRKVDLDLLKDIHELYYHGYLHLPTYFEVFGYQKVDPISKHFKNNHLKTLGHKLTHQLYGDQIKEKKKQTNLERFGVENVSQSPAVREKVKKTNLERYGVENPGQDPMVREKVKKTNIERFGCEYSFQSPDIQEKIKQTNIERYGCESPLQSPEILEKMKRTCLERYGVPNASQSSEIREKVKRTNLERYGVECSFNSQEIREKVKRTNLERYGYENHLQSPDIQEKIKQINLERYGVEYSLQSPEILEKMKRTCLERFGYENPSQSPEIQYKRKQTRKSNDWRYAKLEELVGSDSGKASQFVIGNYSKSNHPKILRRYGLYQEKLSTIEIAIREILEKYKIEYLFKYRPKFMGGKELDFLIPNKNLAIEVNGLYWHSTKFRDKFYHQDKHLRCRSEGIQLLSFT